MQTDPVSGVSDGLLMRVAPAFVPKIFYTNSSNEYWRGSAALTHVTVDGRRDLVAARQHAHLSIRGYAARPGGVSAARRLGPAARQPERLLLVHAFVGAEARRLGRRRRGAARERLSDAGSAHARRAARS